MHVDCHFNVLAAIMFCSRCKWYAADLFARLKLVFCFYFLHSHVKYRYDKMLFNSININCRISSLQRSWEKRLLWNIGRKCKKCCRHCKRRMQILERCRKTRKKMQKNRRSLQKILKRWRKPMKMLKKFRNSKSTKGVSYFQYFLVVENPDWKWKIFFSFGRWNTVNILHAHSTCKIDFKMWNKSQMSE